LNLLPNCFEFKFTYPNPGQDLHTEAKTTKKIEDSDSMQEFQTPGHTFGTPERISCSNIFFLFYEAAKFFLDPQKIFTWIQTQQQPSSVADPVSDILDPRSRI